MKWDEQTEVKAVQFLGSPFRGKKAEELKAKAQAGMTKEIEKLNQEVVKMDSLDLFNFLESKTKTYQDIEQTINQVDGEVFKTILALKYKIFILENSKKKWITYSFFVTVIMLSVLSLFI